MLTNEPGPFDIILHIRRKAGIAHNEDKIPEIFPPKFLPELFSCVYCMSIWVGLFYSLAWIFLPDLPKYLLTLPFALSGGAVLIDSLIERG